MNILCIGAHPDDIELGCGGTLIKAARAGHRIFMYVATRGEASGSPVQRTQESMTSADYIRAERLWVDNFQDSKITVSSELINRIEYLIHQTDPDVIFTHTAEDYHHDHRAISEATLEASRNTQNVLAYEIPITKKFEPQVFYDISDVLEEKVELIRVFESQRMKLFTKANAVTGLANYRAFQNRLNGTINAVESFEVVKMCFGADFRLLKLPRTAPLPQNVTKGMDLSGIFEYSGRERHRLDKIEASPEVVQKNLFHTSEVQNK